MTAVERQDDDQLEKEEGQEEGLPSRMTKFRAINMSDFAQKPKLKVGKAAPKAANSTSTSFKAKCKIFHNSQLQQGV